MLPKLSVADHLSSHRRQCSTGVVSQQRNFCPWSWCASIEQPVSCEKMNGDEDSHALRWVKCRQTGSLVPLKRAIGVYAIFNPTHLWTGSRWSWCNTV